MKLPLSTIAQVIHGEMIGKDCSIAGVSIDTRTLKNGELYIALRGKNFNGHSFIEKAEIAGAAAILVEQECDTQLPQIVVNDSRLALAELAGYWRQQFTIKVIGVTGSNGKTTVKEMLAAILATRASTLFTQGNLNNDIGVPLTLLKLNADHRFAVIEMGANHLGEIAYSSRFVRPDISIITNVAAAHIEGFGSIEGIARAKGEIISSLGSDGVAVINRDDAFYDYWLKLAGNRKTISFGQNNNADIYAEKVNSARTSQSFDMIFTVRTAFESQQIHLQLAGEHNVKNALAAIAAAMQLNIGLLEIKHALEKVVPVTGRMQPLLGTKGNKIIDDTYNANPGSLQAALDALDQNECNWLVLGAFGELGEESAHLHREMGKTIKSSPVERLFATGELAKQTVDAFGIGGKFFDSQEQLIAELNQAITGKETILVKGSRLQKMENVVAAMVDNFRAA